MLLIDSICCQSVTPESIIVVTDGPAPELEDTFDTELVTLINHPVVKRPAPLRNLGISLCNTPFVFVSDDDDYWHYQKAELQLQAIISSKSDFCFTSSLALDIPITRNVQMTYYSFTYEVVNFMRLIIGNCLPMSSCLINLKSCPEFMFYEDPEVRGWADLYTWLTFAKKKYSFIKLKESLLFYRHHNGSMRNGIISSMYLGQLRLIPRRFSLSLLELIIFLPWHSLRLLRSLIYSPFQ